MTRQLVRFLLSIILLAGVAIGALTVLPGSWLAMPAAALMSRVFEVDSTIDEVHLDLFRADPLLSLQGVRLHAETEETLLFLSELELHYSWPDLLRTGQRIQSVHLNRGKWTPGAGERGSSSGPPQALEPLHQPVMKLIGWMQASDWRLEQLIIEELGLLGGGTDGSQQFDLRVNAVVSTRNPAVRSHLIAQGRLGDEAFSFNADMPYLYYLLNGFAPDAAPDLASLSLEWGDSQASMDAQIGRPGKLHGVNAEFSVALTSAEQIRLLWPSATMAPGDFRLQGKLNRARQEWHVQDLNGQWGKSAFSADARVDTRPSPLRVDALVRSDVVHAEDLPFSIPESPQEWLAAESRLRRQYTAFEKVAQGTLQLSVERLAGFEQPVNRLDVSVHAGKAGLRLQLDQLALGTGQVEGVLFLKSQHDDPSSNVPSSAVDLLVKRLGMSADGDLPSDQDGVVSRVAARLHVDLAAGSDDIDSGMQPATLHALVTNAEAGSLLPLLFGVRPLRLMPEAEARARANTVACSFIDVTRTSGQIEIAVMATRTQDRLFLAQGNLADSGDRVDLVLESHGIGPSDGDDARAWQVTGSLDKLTRETVSPILGRDSAAAILNEIVTPAAALLPYLQTGEASLDQNPCAGLAGALRLK